jgi:hypothetical protein
MEFNFSPLRIGILLVCLLGFALYGGFSPPQLAETSILSPRRIGKAWMYCVILFVTGAVSVSVVDHFVGTLDRSNLRIIYIAVGLALMIGAVVWGSGLGVAATTSN